MALCHPIRGARYTSSQPPFIGSSSRYKGQYYEDLLQSGTRFAVALCVSWEVAPGQIAISRTPRSPTPQVEARQGTNGVAFATLPHVCVKVQATWRCEASEFQIYPAARKRVIRARALSNL